MADLLSIQTILGASVHSLFFLFILAQCSSLTLSFIITVAQMGPTRAIGLVWAQQQGHGNPAVSQRLRGLYKL